MKKITTIFIVFLLLVSCKGVGSLNTGSLILKNNSSKVVQFVWLAPAGEFYPTAEEISVGNGGIFETRGLKAGVYDIAIDFKDEYNSFNSKKNGSLRLNIEEGVTKIWIIDEDGRIITE